MADQFIHFPPWTWNKEFAAPYVNSFPQNWQATTLPSWMPPTQERHLIKDSLQRRVVQEQTSKRFMNLHICSVHGWVVVLEGVAVHPSYSAKCYWSTEPRCRFAQVWELQGKRNIDLPAPFPDATSLKRKSGLWIHFANKELPRRKPKSITRPREGTRLSLFLCTFIALDGESSAVS